MRRELGKFHSFYTSEVALLRRYVFRCKRLPILDCVAAKAILEARARGLSQVEVSLDLGKTRTSILLQEEGAVLRGQVIPMEWLEEIASDEEGLYLLEAGVLKKAAFSREGHFYKLRRAPQGGAPTLEIDGIHMHRIKELSPWQDSLLKVKAAKVKPGSKVLDTCTGLGYTAILSLKLGAHEVTTIEVNPAVLEMASYNPWSCPLEDQRITILLGNAAEVVTNLPSNEYSNIIHDPPRFSLAGELYSLRFYKELYRVLTPGGVLFHYTGAPGMRRGKDVAKGVAQRLREAGFEARLLRKIQGVVAFKLP